MNAKTTSVRMLNPNKRVLELIDELNEKNEKLKEAEQELKNGRLDTKHYFDLWGEEKGKRELAEREIQKLKDEMEDHEDWHKAVDAQIEVDIEKLQKRIAGALQILNDCDLNPNYYNGVGGWKWGVIQCLTQDLFKRLRLALEGKQK